MEETIYSLRNEIKLLRGIIDGNYPDDIYWLMTKVDNQRKAILSIEKRGKGHTKEEREELALASA